MTKAEYPVAEQQSREPPLTTELPAFVMREPWLDLKMRMWLTMLMVDTPTAIGFAFTWLWFSGSSSDGIGAFRTHFPGFRHADGTLDFQRFRASLRPAGCAIAGSRVNLSLAAQHGGLAPGDWGGLLVRWWFENSRAYLYYFFIVNDCQFVAGHVRMVPRDRSNGGEVFVRCAFPYKAIVNFLISRVIMSMSLHEKVFLWRVRFWLRMNAGGVLNTCKSNGIGWSLLRP